MPFLHDDGSFSIFPKSSKEIFEELGKVMFLWGILENHLDCMVTNLRCIPHPAVDIEQAPIALNRKIELCKGAFKNIPELKPHSQEYTDWNADLKGLVKRRHALVHGSWYAFNDDEPVSFEIRLMTKRKGKFVAKLYKHNATTLRELAHDIDKLNDRLQPLVQRVDDLLFELDKIITNFRD